MHLNEYQSEAMRTAIYPIDRGLEYAVLGLTSEAGEVAGKLKKIIRDKGAVLTEADRVALGDEAADCLWYLAAIARELETTLEVLAQRNLNKLSSRKARGVLKGSGDTR